ncbi:GNAT family N-acetyltransferase [Microbacterium murale]|uniref:GNAT superfamily N-acetyltransferase n=1 Tax=Microbacterium murale TaxID=1081040 RepID=A0ABU0PBT1_9MICO|nr:GNAT family N-acetyltransferase [Microbacterium murale]MDQ0644796.1 GNAT superfamily N-acetyltransferase [Microbacterium murale]
MTLMQFPGTITVRSFRTGDGVAIAEAWTRSAPQDGITARRLRDLILMDRNFDADGLFIAEDQGAVVGAAYAVRRRVAHDGDDLEPSTGWIPFFFVVPNHRRHGLGRTLIMQAFDWLRGNGIREVIFSAYTPNYVLPGLDAERYPEASALLASMGFSRVERPSAMDRSLIGYEMPAEIRERVDMLRNEGWHLGTPDDDDLVPLIKIAGDSFNSDWARAIREGIVGGMPTERIIIAKNPEGTVLGWAMHGTYESVIERFGPFGVLPESRGTGLGKVLLHLTLERMTALGAHSAWFLWADEGSTASALYAKTGFAATRTFDILRAEIGDSE